MGWREHRRFKARARASSRPARCTFLHAEKSFAAGGAIGIRIGHTGDHESARPLRARSIRRCAYDARENRSSVSASSIGQVILGAWAVRLRNVPNMPFNSNPLPPSVLVQLQGEQHVLKHLLRRSCWACGVGRQLRAGTSGDASGSPRRAQEGEFTLARSCPPSSRAVLLRTSTGFSAGFATYRGSAAPFRTRSSGYLPVP